jgi:N-methylhydantoinase A
MVLKNDFHQTHKDVFAISDNQSEVEIVGWRTNISCKLRENANLKVVEGVGDGKVKGSRQAYFGDIGLVDVGVFRFEEMNNDIRIEGPSIIESSFTTVVVDPGSVAYRNVRGSLICEQI